MIWNLNAWINLNSGGYYGNIFTEFAILGIQIRRVILTKMLFYKEYLFVHAANNAIIP